MKNLEVWPPEFSIRRSSRARHPSIKISLEKGLEIILPMRCQLSTANKLLHDKRSWIEKNSSYLHEFFKSKQNNLELPIEIALASCRQRWDIRYVYSPFKTRAVCSGLQELTLLGNIDDKMGCVKILKEWVKQKAQEILPPMLHSVSDECQLHFASWTIRSQHTRWGSCNSKKRISLNDKLIFFPPDKVKHIIIHELCHTVHLNHSENFWCLVAQHDQQWNSNRQWFKQTHKWLPLWLQVI